MPDATSTDSSPGGGLFARLVTSGAPALMWVALGQPFDTIKTRLQTTDAARFQSARHCASETVAREGVMSLWKGSVPALLLSVPYSTIMFGSYRVLRDYPILESRPFQPGNRYSSEDSRDVDYPYLPDVFLHGAASGIVLTTFHNPLELWRVQLQTRYDTEALQRRPVSVLQTLSARCKSVGVRRALFAGASMLFVRNIPGNGVYFSALEFFSHLIKTSEFSEEWTDLQRGMTEGALTGLVYQGTMYPCDTIKARMMTDPSDQKGSARRVALRAACAGILREHGIRGFYRGLGITLVKAVPVNAGGIALWRFLQDRLDAL
jgi:solute carrier family 25 carnitine/acylcarnitine transporter 20/29